MSTTSTPTARVGVVIPAGGTARRLGGVDKPSLEVGGRTILDRLLDAVGRWPVVVVGPARSTEAGTRDDGVRWCLEDPPLGGPAAALAAGVAALDAWCGPDGLDVVVVLAGDQPFAARSVERLLAGLAGDPTADAVMGLDGSGRAQPLVAAYRVRALRRHLSGDLTGSSLHRVVGELRRAEVRLTSTEEIDVDDPGALELARRVAAE